MWRVQTLKLTSLISRIQITLSEFRCERCYIYSLQFSIGMALLGLLYQQFKSIDPRLLFALWCQTAVDYKARFDPVSLYLEYEHFYIPYTSRSLAIFVFSNVHLRLCISNDRILLCSEIDTPIVTKQINKVAAAYVSLFNIYGTL